MATFQSVGFRDWKNAKGVKRGALPIHEATVAHKDATVKASAFKDIVAGKAKDIHSSLSKAYEDRVKKNHGIMLSMIDMVIVLGQRNVPFRGHGWSKELRREDRNFDFFLHWKSQFDPLLSDHLQFAKKNASYLSPVIQNELIALAGLEVKESILKDVRSAGRFSVMADECTDVATLEQMSMCIRFVDESTPDQPQVREEFVGFVQLDRTSAAFISEAILQFLKDCNLNISNLRGQGYDGASVMAGKVSGVSTRILEAQPRAMYHHCRGHNLNPVISSSCNQVPEIRNLFDSVRTISWFLGASGKRKFILRKYLKPEDISSLVTGDDSLPEDEQELSDQLIRGAVAKQVPKLCETRWSAQVATLSSVMAKYKAMYLALNDIAIESSNTEARINALSYIRLLQSPTFIISVVVTQCVLSYSHPLCLALQKTDCDIVKAYRNAKLCQTTISAQRNEIKFSELWNKAEAIAAEVGTELTKPRTCHTSRYRSNAGVDTQDTDNAETYYRRNVYY